MTEKHPDYWKVKAAVLNTQLVHLRAQAAVTAANAEQAAALTAAGLDATKDYILTDEDETIAEKT